MSHDRWQQLEHLFHAIAALPAAQRHEALQAACGDDREMRAEVERLLRADADAVAFLNAIRCGDDA
jgi:hypothetical protein